MTEPVTVRVAEPGDFSAWSDLFRGYAEFYAVHQDAQMRQLVWSWIHDPAIEMRAYVAETAAGLVGLAHTRPFRRPLAASVGEYLDDLFVDPSARGLGVAQALLAEIGRQAAADGRSVVRWFTKADNATARRLYDQVADVTAWVTYDMSPTQTNG